MVEISTLPEERLQAGDAILFVRIVNGAAQAYKLDGEYVTSFSDVAGLRDVAQVAISSSEAAQNVLSGIAGDVTAAKVMISAGLNGDAALTFRGYWDAGANLPGLSSGIGNEGDLYIVSASGTTPLDGQSRWDVGDGAWFTQGRWVYYARASWAAVAQTVTALAEIRAGSARLLSGESGNALTVTDAYGYVAAVVREDGSYASDESESPSFGLKPNGIFSGDIRITSDGNALTLVDPFGFVLATISMNGSYNSGGESHPDFGLTPDGIFAGGLQVVDYGEKTLRLTDIRGFPLRLDASCLPKLADLPPVIDRQPGAADDVWTLYAAGDVWQTGGEAHTCLYPNAGSAVWQADLGLPQRPGDQFASSLAAAYGTTRQVSGYNGPLLDVVAVKSTGSVVVSIGQDAEGYLSRSDLIAARAGVSTGTPLYVAKIYDQSGNGHHIMAPGYDGTAGSVVVANLPRVGERRHGKLDLVSWAPEPAALQPLTLPSTLSLSAGSASVLLYGAVSSCNCPLYTTYSLLGLGSASGQAVTLTVGGGTESGRLALSDFSPGTVLAGSSRTLNVHHGLIGMTLGGSDSLTLHVPTIYSAGQQIAMGTGFSGRQFTGGVLGGSPAGGGNSSALQFSGLILLKTAAADADMKAAYTDACRLYDWTPQIRDRLDCFGSSTTQGYLNKDGWCWPQMLNDYLETPFEVRSVSVAGSKASDFLQYTLANMLADATDGSQPRRKHAITWYGNNDVNGGQSVATVVANNALIHQKLRAAGYEKLFILGQYNAALNAAIRQAVADGTIDADAFIDPWSMPPMSNHGDTALYHDGTHPTEALDRLGASFIARTINAHLEN